jgi:Ca-activated chloride channel homolog
MKRIFFLFVPLLVLVLAFRPLSSHTVNGIVTDDKGSPLAGVTITVKGTSAMTSTSSDGKFSIVVADKNATLVFSRPGMVSTQIKINGRSTISVSMSTTHVVKEILVAKKDRVMNIGPKGGMPYTTKSYGYVNNAPADYNTESYDHITEGRFLKVTDNPLSTFSIDVDAASYSNVRRFLNQNQLPPAGAVRIEEMVNYFTYDYPQPVDKAPFSITTEISDAPWNKEHKLVLIGLQGKKIPTANLPASNLVFLIDVSGSMQGETRLGLVKQSMKMLVDQLREQDKVAMVVYAGAAGLVLPPTSGYEKTKIKDAIDRLEAGGSTAGGAGIKLAYKTAKDFFVKGGNNRVILCTDGDFNVGASSDDEMETLIEQERKSGVFLTVLGYGMGNYKDSKMQKLADKGNGNHAYIDGINEAKKVLVNEFGGTLFTIAKDVKLQVEFNPAKVAGYRLIGYENRMLAKEDFNNDQKDAGELGSGHTVTALYEVIPAGVNSKFLEKVDPLKYQKDIKPLSSSKHSDEIMTVKFRYKAPDGDASALIEHPVKENMLSWINVSDNFRFASAVAEFGMLLRNSEFKSNASYESVLARAKKAMGKDVEGYRKEFISLVENAQSIVKKVTPKKEEIAVN